MRLTIGIIARNGVPHLSRCLASVAQTMGAIDGVEVILVDCCSQDDTLGAMLTFARENRGVRVFRLEGVANAACARNTILENTRPGAVFLVDGDVAISVSFVTAALREIREGTADVVVGQLPEVLHDDEHRPKGCRGDRYGIQKRCFVGVSGGLSVLSAEVVARGFRFDEALRMGEDTDFSIRIADEFRIVALPLPMGTHYTTDYFHGGRARAYVRQLYVRPKGALVRKHILHPRRLWRARKSFSGMVAGGVLQGSFVCAVAFGEYWGLSILMTIACVDLARFWTRDSLTRYVLIRLVSPWVLGYGLISPERFAPSYTVRALEKVEEVASTGVSD
jgi:glycosyltransferase involved in cell wall biosynthesis